MSKQALLIYTLGAIKARWKFWEESSIPAPRPTVTKSELFQIRISSFEVKVRVYDADYLTGADQVIYIPGLKVTFLGEAYS